MNKCPDCGTEFETELCPNCSKEKDSTVSEVTTEAQSADKSEKKPNGFKRFMSKVGNAIVKGFKATMNFLSGKVASSIIYALPYFAFILFNVLVWMFFSASIRKFDGESLGSFFDYAFGNSFEGASVLGFGFIFTIAVLSTLVALFMAVMLAIPGLRKLPVRLFGEHYSLASLCRKFSIVFYAIFMVFGIIISSYSKLGTDGELITRGACGPLFTTFSIIFLVHVGLALFISWYNDRYNSSKPEISKLFDDMNEPKVKEKKPKPAPVNYTPVVVNQQVAQPQTVATPVYTAPVAVAPVQAPELEPIPEINTPKSKFKGGAFANFFINLLVVFVSGITLSLALPGMLCWKQRWMSRNTYYDGRSLNFNGKGIQLFGRYLLWLLLSVVTLGIFAIFVLPVSVQKWKTKHTHFSDTHISEDPEQGPKSYFDGGALGLFGINFVSGLVTAITLGIGSFWAHCYKQRWLAKHTVIDDERLYFNGTGFQYFGKKIIWILLTIVTFGIYSFWLVVKQENWTASHTHLESKKEEIESALAEINEIKARNKAKIEAARAQGIAVAGNSYQGSGAGFGTSTGKAGLIMSIISLALTGILFMIYFFGML